MAKTMFLPRFHQFVLIFVTLCVRSSHAFEQLIGVLQQNCQERVLKLDLDNSGVVETNELQPFVDSLGCTDSLGSDLPFDEIEVFCTEFIYRCQNAGNENKETVSPTTVAPTLAPTANPTAQPIAVTVTLDSSTPEGDADGSDQESSSTLPPIDSLPPELSSTGIGSDPSDGDDNDETTCAFFNVRCQQWLMIGAPIAAGLLLGLCLGLVYIETRSWRHKKRRELRAETDQSSLVPVAGDEDDHVSMYPVAEESTPPPPDVETAQGVVIVRSRSRSRGPHKRLAQQQQPMETLVEGDDEDASQLVSLSDVISSHSGGGDDSCQDPTVLSDSTPLHKNTYRPTPPVDLDADDDDDDASAAWSAPQPETETRDAIVQPAETRQDHPFPSTMMMMMEPSLQTSSSVVTDDTRQHDDAVLRPSRMPPRTDDEPTVKKPTASSAVSKKKARTIVRDADFASESLDL